MLKSYASCFVSYLLNNLKNLNFIERVVLYGSAAKDTAAKESDIDIFIEIKTSLKIGLIKLKSEIAKIERQFYQSREYLLFRTKGIENKFSIKIGYLKKWKDLYRSIASTGIVLYGPYEAKNLPSDVKHFVIIFWDKIGKNRGAFLNKIYGFKVKAKQYAGYLSKCNGIRLGKSCIMLPVQYKEEMHGFLKKYKVSAHIIEAFI